MVQTDLARFACGLLRLVLVGADFAGDGAGANVVWAAARSSVAIVVEFQEVLFVVATDRFTVPPKKKKTSLSAVVSSHPNAVAPALQAVKLVM